MNSYRIINIILTGVLIVIFSYSGFFVSYFSEEGVSCAFKSQTGLECATCGFTRDFNTFLTERDFSNTLNQFSLSVFIFLIIQFFLRFGITVLNLETKFKQLYLVDIILSIAYFLIVFIPVLLLSISQSISLLR